MVVQNGHLTGYYSAAAGNQAIYSTAATAVADGFWHQVALTVNATGGLLFVDGIQVGAGTWLGTPGPPTGTQPMQIGKYYSYPGGFQGTIDEVTLWNRALGVAELNNLQRRQLNGNEDGLVALWHFDEGTGTSAGDATGHGFIGLLINNPVWVTSSAPIVFNPVAGTALEFDGVNGFVTVPSLTPTSTPPVHRHGLVPHHEWRGGGPRHCEQIRGRQLDGWTPTTKPVICGGFIIAAATCRT